MKFRQEIIETVQRAGGFAKPKLNQEILDIIRASGCTVAEFDESCRRVSKYWHLIDIQKRARGEEVSDIEPEAEPSVEIAMDQIEIVVPVRNSINGEEIGTATLKPTGSNGIYLASMEIYGGTATGYIHLPVREGDKVDTAYVKED